MGLAHRQAPLRAKAVELAAQVVEGSFEPGEVGIRRHATSI